MKAFISIPATPVPAMEGHIINTFGHSQQLPEAPISMQETSTRPRKESYTTSVRWDLPELKSTDSKPIMLHSPSLCRSLQHWRGFIRNPFRKWIECRRKQKLCMRSERIQAALSLASLSAALATVVASTAVSTMDKQDSRTGLAVASAAALLAAHIADFAKCVGADQQSVLASVSAGQSVKHLTDILAITTSAAASLQGTRGALKGWKRTCIHASITESKIQLSPFCESSLSSSGSPAGVLLNNEILGRGAYLLVRVMADKEHRRRFVSVCLEDKKQVILKLTSRHLAGAVRKVKKRVVFQVLERLPTWPGRSLLYNGLETSCFGLLTSQGTIEFECSSNYDHQIWTQGILNLLNVIKRECPLNSIYPWQ